MTTAHCSCSPTTADFAGDYGLVEKAQNTFQDCLSRVPFVVKPPADVPTAAGVRDQLVELVDFPATVYALAGVDCGYWHFGRSLDRTARTARRGTPGRGLLRGRSLACGKCRRASERAFSANSALGLYSPRVNLQVAEVGEGTALPHTKAAMCRTERMKYVRRAFEMDELYDLTEDPGETRNLIAETGVSWTSY